MPGSSWRQELDLPHSLEALVAILLGLEEPLGAGGGGEADLRAGKTGPPSPPPPPSVSLEFQERVWAGTGGSLHSTRDRNGRGVGEERRQRKHRRGGTK